MYIKGHFAIGRYIDGKWIESTARLPNNYVKDMWAHHKSIEFRFGNIEEKNRLQFTYALNHQVQYGGELYRYESGQYVVSHQPRGIDEFLRIMLAKEERSADYPYAAGSSIGSHLFKFDYKLKNKDVISVYKQHFFEDGSGLAFENYRDGIYGIEYKTKKKSLLSGAVFEYIYTKNQNGPIHFQMSEERGGGGLPNLADGNDNYYNNYEYVQGPSYFGRTKGTPLFLSPEYNKDGRLNFTSSRIISVHLGVEGYLHPTLQYRLLATTGQTWGLYYYPYTSVKKGFASGLDLIYNCPKVQDLDIKLSLGFNKGEFFSNDTFGGGITITKRGVIFGK
jgi:hypothetical protein